MKSEKVLSSVGADASVRPAVCTRNHERANANLYTVCRGRCPHRPARDAPAKSHDLSDLQLPPNLRRGGVLPLPYGTSGNIAFFRYIAANLLLPIGRTEASAPTGRFTVSPKKRAILRLRPARAG